MAIKRKGFKPKAKPFAMMLWQMGQSAPYRALSFTARGVLMELHMQYNGSNNGDLSATRSMAKDWGGQLSQHPAKGADLPIEWGMDYPNPK